MMGSKLTYDYVKSYFLMQGCELLEDVYVNNNALMSYRCKCGNVSRIKFGHFQQGVRCRECGVKNSCLKRKLKYSQIEKDFLLKGWKLLDRSFKNVDTPLKYKCSCGNVSHITYKKLKHQKGCPKCSKNERYTLNEAKNIFSKGGCALLTKKYDNNSKLMRYRCSCGRISTISLNNFRQGCRCKNCGIKKISGENHPRWNPDREKVNLYKIFQRRIRTLLKKCLRNVGQSKQLRTVEHLGYSGNDLMLRITNHPGWSLLLNQEWHIDHIFPVKAFVDAGIYDMKIINSLDNLQPLLSRDNCSKNAKYDKKAFEIWLSSKGYCQGVGYGI